MRISRRISALFWLLFLCAGAALGQTAEWLKPAVGAHKLEEVIG